VAGVVRGLQPACHTGVQESCAVEVDADSTRVGQAGGALDVLDRVDRAAAAVVGVLEANEGGRAVMDVLGSNVGLDLFRSHDAARSINEVDLDAGECGDGGALVVVGVGFCFDDNLVAWAGPGLDCHLVGHDAGGDEEGGLHPVEFGTHLLEAVDGRVLALDVVADLGLCHGLSHGGRGPGHCVASKVNWQVHLATSSDHRGPVAPAFVGSR